MNLKCWKCKTIEQVRIFYLKTGYEYMSNFEIKMGYLEQPICWECEKVLTANFHTHKEFMRTK